MRYCFYSDIGTVRQSNEDCAWSGVNPFNNLAGIVCDGLGGYKGGSAASEITVNVFKKKFEQTDLTAFTTDQINTWINNIIEEARINISHHIEKNPKLANMATTLVCCLIINDRAYIYNVGDSRAWLISKTLGSKQITEDQNLYNYLVKINASQEVFKMHRDNLYAITQFIGAMNKKNIKPDVFTITLTEGDFISLTSDGCHNFIDERDFAKIILETPDFNSIPSTVVAQSIANESNDNLSIVILGV